MPFHLLLSVWHLALYSKACTYLSSCTILRSSHALASVTHMRYLCLLLCIIIVNTEAHPILVLCLSLVYANVWPVLGISDVEERGF